MKKEIPEFIPKHCYICDYFKKVPSIDQHKGTCTFYNEPRYTSFSCLANKYLSNDDKDLITEKTYNNISSRFYIGASILSFIFILLCMFLPLFEFIRDSLYIRSALHFIMLSALTFLLVINLIVWFKAWHSISNERSAISPTIAIIFLFIPIFNIFWWFYMPTRFAKAFNTLLVKNKIYANGIYKILFIVYSFSMIALLLGTFYPERFISMFLSGLVLGLLFIPGTVFELCRAINRVPKPEQDGI